MPNKIFPPKAFILLFFLVFQGCTVMGPSFPKVDYGAHVISKHINQGDWSLWDVPHGRPTYRKTGEILIEFKNRNVTCREQALGLPETSLTPITENICLFTFKETFLGVVDTGEGENVNESNRHVEELPQNTRVDSNKNASSVKSFPSVGQRGGGVQGQPIRYSFSETLNFIKDNNEIVKYAEPNFIFSIQNLNDLSPKGASKQWFWKHLREYPADKEDAINEDKGQPPVVVAILDTGLDVNHAGLDREKIFIKDNIFVTPNDTNGHGTLVAGLIVGKDGIGVNPNAHLWSIKVLDDDGYGEVSKIIQALDWIEKQNDRSGSQDSRVQIVNMSFGFYGKEKNKEKQDDHVKILRDKVTALANQHVVLVGAAGNDFVGDVMYPAKFESVIAVGSHDQGGWISRFSNWGEPGKRAVDVFAPGNDLLSTNISSSLTSVNGTSAATAVVSGLFSLLPRHPSDSFGTLLERIKKLMPKGGIYGKEGVYPEDSLVFKTHHETNLTKGKLIPRLNICRALSASEIEINAICGIEITQFSTKGKVFSLKDDPEIIIRFSALARKKPDSLLVCIQINKEEKSSCQKEETFTIPRNFEGEFIAQYRISKLIKGDIKTLIPPNGQVDLTLKVWIDPERIKGDPDIQKIKTIYFSKEKIQNAKVLNLWMQPLEFVDERTERALNAIIENTGNAALKDITLEAYAIPAVHEGVWSVGHVLLGKKNVEIKPGSHLPTSFSLPDSFIPPEGKMTFLLTVKKGERVLDHFLTSYHYPKNRQGLASAQFAKNVHRRLAELAVELLGSTLTIPDLHEPEKDPCGIKDEYLGKTNSYNSWGYLLGFSEDLNIPSKHPFKASKGEKTVDDFLRFQNFLRTEKGGKSGFNLISGAADPDSIDIVNDYTYEDVFDSHFWIVDKDDNYGLGSWKFSLSSLFSGNFNFVENHNSALHNIKALLEVEGGGTLEKGAKDIYKKAQSFSDCKKQKKYKQIAWWMVGQALHLLGDLSLPSHVNDENSHGIFGARYHDHVDRYNTGGLNLLNNSLNDKVTREKYGIIDNFINPYCDDGKLKENGDPCDNTVIKFDPIRFLAFTTAQIGNAFPYYYDDESHEMPGNQDIEGDKPYYSTYLKKELEIIKNATQNAGHTTSYLKKVGPQYIEEHSLPYALRAMAGLIFYFACETNQLKESDGCGKNDHTVLIY